MSVASARLSPAANLLRNSRLFAVPAPLPSPPPFVTSQSVQGSDTATQPYPTHAAIETYQLSRRRGDWGLKRSLPAKLSRKKSTQAIRVRGGIDTIEHIADYESAGDHTINLQKWQALHLPILKPPEPTTFRTYQSTRQPQTPRGAGTSVFEDETDNVFQQENKNVRRWRFEGPWLQGLSGLEFEAYLKKVRSEKEAFREYLRASLAETKRRREQEKAQNEGRAFDEMTINDEVTKQELEEHIKSLRKRPEDFTEIISNFLDIPEGPKANSARMNRKDKLSSDEYALSGPPKTHPSAGLSYLRSSAYVINHPEHGPQVHCPPVPGRVLKHPNQEKNQIYGVAGVVSNVKATASSLADGLKQSDTDSSQEAPAGGWKILCEPVRASVDTEGKIQLALKLSSDDSRAIYISQEEVNQASPTTSMEATPVEVRQASSIPLLDEDYRRDKDEAEGNVLQSLPNSLKSMSPESASAMDRLNTAMGPKSGSFR